MSNQLYSWGDPYREDTSWEQIVVGDRVRVKPSAQPYPGSYGTVESIDEKTGTYTVSFPNNRVQIGYDGDDLVKVTQKKDMV